MSDRKIPIGIDFGTTNTTVCIAIPDNDAADKNFRVECLKFNETEQGGDDYIPTVVLYDERPNSDGSARLPLIGSKAMRPLLRGNFNANVHRLCVHGKFLLGEESRGEAHWRDYLATNPHYASNAGALRYDTDNYKPSRVVGDFFKALFEEICTHHLIKAQLGEGKERAELSDLAVVVTCPEAWKHSLGLPLDEQAGATQQGQSVALQANPHPLLKNILEKRLGLSTVEIKSEPEAATVYFAKQFEHSNKKHFSGRVMIVDYGGGTLDICLSGVEFKDSGLVVTPEGGGHHAADGRFVAGVRFDERVFELAWQAADAEKKLEASFDDLKRSSSFQKFMNLIDKAKRDDWPETTESLRDQALGNATEDVHLFGLDVDFNERMVKLRVTASTFVQAFNDANRPTLTTCLAAFEGQLGDENQRQKLPKENFRLLLVGGFSRLELARRHVIEHFGWKPDDATETRFARFKPEADTAFAIAKGAALLAARWARVEGRMRYSVGLVGYNGGPNDPPEYNPALTEGMKYVEASQWMQARHKDDKANETSFDFLPDGMSVEAYIQQGDVYRSFKINVGKDGHAVRALDMMPDGDCKKVLVKFRYDEAADGVCVRFEDAANPKHFKEYQIQDLIERVFHQPALSRSRSAT